MKLWPLDKRALWMTAQVAAAAAFATFVPDRFAHFVGLVWLATVILAAAKR